MSTRFSIAVRGQFRRCCELLAQHDMRLVPAAAGTWLATLLGLRLGWAWTVIVGILAALIGLVLLHRRWRKGRGIRVLAMALVLCGVGTAILTGYRLHADAVNPLRALAARGVAVQLWVELEAEPKPISSPGFAGRAGGIRTVAVQARAEALTEHGRTSTASGSVLLLAPVRGWAHLLRGQRAEAWGVLAASDSPQDTVAVLRVRGDPNHVTAAPMLERAANALRVGLRTATSGLAGDTHWLIPGLVIGDSSGLRQPVIDDFRTAGMAYLMAVGGYHFMIVCGAVLWLLRRFGVGPRVSALLGGLTLLAFLEVVGPKPSVLRAALMVGAGLLALGTGRGRATSSALASSVLVLVWWQPSFAGDVTFLLSVLATAGLLLLARPITEALVRRRIPRGVAELVGVALVAYLVTAPLIAGVYGQFGIAAVGANVIAEPAFVPAMLLGALSMACSPLSAVVAGFLAHLAEPEAAFLIWVAHRAAQLPAAALPWPTGWLGGTVLAAVLLAIVVAMRSRRLRVLMIAVLSGVFIVLVPERVIAPNWPPNQWAMIDCDVGQGDGEVLATGEPGRAVVVDTGPDEQGIDECLTRLDITRVPLVVLSHLHADHIGGLDAVLRGRSVGAVAVGPTRVPSWAWTTVRQETAAAKVPLLELSVGQHLQWPDLGLDVLGPAPQEAWPAGDDPSGTIVNNSSLVMRASTTAGHILLTGDVELAAQAALLDAGVDLTADILKIPHHGSRYSAPGFLDAVHARVAVASVGAGNPYGHPSALTLGRLSADGALVLRTDHDGDVAILPGPVVVRRGSPRPPPHGSAHRGAPSARSH